MIGGCGCGWQGWMSQEAVDLEKRFSQLLIAVVGVDVEAEDGVYFYRLLAAHGGTELPAGKRGHNFRGHGGGAGLEDLKISQVAGSIEPAFDHDAGMRKIRRQIGANALRPGRRAGRCAGVFASANCITTVPIDVST